MINVDYIKNLESSKLYYVENSRGEYLRSLDDNPFGSIFLKNSTIFYINCIAELNPRRLIRIYNTDIKNIYTYEYMLEHLPEELL